MESRTREIDRTRAQKREGESESRKSNEEREMEGAVFYTENHSCEHRAETETKIHATGDVYICQRI